MTADRLRPTGDRTMSLLYRITGRTGRAAWIDLGFFVACCALMAAASCEAHAQTDTVQHLAPPSPWLSPGFLLSAGAALLGIIGWFIKQDRRIEGLREAHEKLVGSMERYATREGCSAKHADVAQRASLHEAFEQLRKLEREQAEDRAALKVALEKFSASVDRLDRLEERLSRYFEDSSPRIKRG